MAEQLKSARIHTSLFKVSMKTFLLHKYFLDFLSFFLLFIPILCDIIMPQRMFQCL